MEINGIIVDIVFGFLGSGKTTFIIRALEKWGSDEKIVVLVNEFGDVGIDGELLTGQGGDVVEMPSGCICCTLQADFRSQMFEICSSIKPKRIIIEPTGVATVAQIQSIVNAQLFEDSIKKMNRILIADATGFMGLYKANRHFVESQVENAQLVLLNKCDKVDKRKTMVTQGAISAINPEISILMTEFGVVDWVEYQSALSTASISKKNIWREEDHAAHTKTARTEAPIYHHETNKPHTFFQENEDALGYESISNTYGALFFGRKALEELYQELNASNSVMGEIVRAKGIFRVESGWILMELASRELSCQPVMTSSESKISLIGKGLDRELIMAALERCRMKKKSKIPES